ncbi:MAG: type II toxin-antitoxin system RelE/ParE family toxin [Candidatus Omnitrophota bacterium]
MSTTKYEIILESRVEKYYLKVDSKIAKQLDKCFEYLEKNPFYFPGKIKRLEGQKGLWRYRVGDLRIIYEVIQEKREVVVLLISSRGDVYKKI